ncbi:Prolyl 4-hydroxylase 2 [Chlorella vulgaris]
MSSPAGPVRRSTRSGAAASSPIAESPVPSNPLADDGPKSSPAAQHVPAAKSSSGSRKPSGSPSAVLLLAVLLISGGIMYNQWSQQQAAAAEAAVAEAAAGERGAAVASTQHRSALEQEAAVEQEAPAEEDEPPPPPMTAEEVAVFELAAGEHYGSPPGFQLPDFQEEVDVSSEEEEQAEQHDQEEAEQQATEADPGEHQEEHQGEGERAQRVLSSNADEEAAAAAAATFDPEAHRQYLELPPWPEADEQALTGSWHFTEQVYDYAASLPMTQVLSWDNPRLVLLPSFLSPQEVGHMIRVSKDNLERSEVLVADGEDQQSDIRTSFGFWPESDPVVDAITERLHRTIGVPQAFGEGLYVLNYQVDQKYEAHNDHCMDALDNKVAEPACLDFLKRAGGPECGPGKGGPTCGDRVATFILYLKSPTRGGKTAFPEADITRDAMGDEHRSGNAPDEWYCHDDRVLAASPPAGTGVLFWDYRPSNGTGAGSFQDGSAQPNAHSVYEAMHSGCPVTEGEKYIATRWIRASGFDYHLLNQD